MPNVVKGGNTYGLVNYLVGPGRANEHTRPHIVAGSNDFDLSDIKGQILTVKDASEIASILDVAMLVTGSNPMNAKRSFNVKNLVEKVPGKGKNHVWHCSLSLPAEQGKLGDEKWEAIAREFVTQMGFEVPGDRMESCQWVAIHHGDSKGGNDHIHVVVNRVRNNGTCASVSNDFVRAQMAANVLEKKFDLGVLESREFGRGSRGYKPHAVVHKNNRTVIESSYLVGQIRDAMLASGSEAEFVYRLRASGVLVYPRYAKGGKEAVTGFSVASRRDDGTVLKYAASKIDRDLSLSRIRHRFPEPDSVQLALNLEAWETFSPTVCAMRISGSVPEQMGAFEATRALNQISLISSALESNPTNAAYLAGSSRALSDLCHALGMGGESKELLKTLSAISQHKSAFSAPEMQAVLFVAHKVRQAPPEQKDAAIGAVIGAGVTAMASQIARAYHQAGQIQTAKEITAHITKRLEEVSNYKHVANSLDSNRTMQALKDAKEINAPSAGDQANSALRYLQAKDSTEKALRPPALDKPKTPVVTNPTAQPEVYISPSMKGVLGYGSGTIAQNPHCDEAVKAFATVKDTAQAVQDSLKPQEGSGSTNSTSGGPGEGLEHSHGVEKACGEVEVPQGTLNVRTLEVEGKEVEAIFSEDTLLAISRTDEQGNKVTATFNEQGAIQTISTDRPGGLDGKGLETLSYHLDENGTNLKLGSGKPAVKTAKWAGEKQAVTLNTMGSRADIKRTVGEFGATSHSPVRAGIEASLQRGFEI